MNFTFKQFPIIKTDRLILRRTLDCDAKEILFIRSDREINKYIKRDAPQNIKDAKGFITKVNQGYEKGENIYWAICLKENSKMIGSICLWHFSKNRKQAEFGYDLFPKFQSQGLMTEALKAVLEFGYDLLNLTEMEAFTHFRNKSSIKLLLSNGF